MSGAPPSAARDVVPTRPGMTHADLGAPSSLGVGGSSSTDAIVRADETYELCLVGTDTATRRVCYLVARSDEGPACSVLRASVDGVDSGRCTPPEDCERVMQTLDAQFPHRGDGDYMPASDNAEALQVVLLAPDRGSTFADPTWQRAQIGYSAAEPELRGLAADFATRCR